MLVPSDIYIYIYIHTHTLSIYACIYLSICLYIYICIAAQADIAKHILKTRGFNGLMIGYAGMQAWGWPLAAFGYMKGLGGLGFRGLGVRGLGFRV